ncbi:MAG: SLC13 family permease [Anaerolinea sp.]|nr:SLC13 family permease [Anaerolinea sp.]
MTLHIGLLLVIVVVSLVLFALERVPVDVIAIGVMLALIFSGMLTPEEAFAGFGSSTVLLILGLLIQTEALTRTGVVDYAGRLIYRYTGSSPNRVLLIIMLASAVVGAFMSNTASTAFFVPLVIGIARRSKLSPALLLMPLAFASILSSSVTLVSTSSNILISGLMRNYGLAPMGMFELAPVGLPIVAVGIAYMFFLGKRLIPDRFAPEEIEGGLESRLYVTELIISPESPFIGKTLGESAIGRDLDLRVLRIVREKKRYLVPRQEQVLEHDDVLLVEGGRDEILKVKTMNGADIKADAKLSDPELDLEDLGLVEGLILPGSPLIGRTLNGIRFRDRYGLQVLAINRHGQSLRRKLSLIRLELGDSLLIQGEGERIAQLERDDIIRILETGEPLIPNPQRARLAISIFVGSLALAVFLNVPLAVAMLIGALLVFLTRCVTPEEAYRNLEWKAIILIGSMLALGVAMDKTGTADYLAGVLVNLVGEASPLLILTGFFIITVLLTQPMSNQAAAVVVVPVALQTALQLQLDPRPFAMMIAVAASCSYLTPLEPSCLMVYAPGRYKFVDFLKVGSILTVLIYFIAILIVPTIWSLTP